jgi:hypothetical protein
MKLPSMQKSTIESVEIKGRAGVPPMTFVPWITVAPVHWFAGRKPHA